MTAPTEEQVAGWWAILEAHRQRGGLCPICRTARRCRARCEAYEHLVTHDRYHLGPPVQLATR